MATCFWLTTSVEDVHIKCTYLITPLLTIIHRHLSHTHSHQQCLPLGSLLRTIHRSIVVIGIGVCPTLLTGCVKLSQAGVALFNFFGTDGGEAFARSASLSSSSCHGLVLKCKTCSFCLCSGDVQTKTLDKKGLPFFVKKFWAERGEKHIFSETVYSRLLLLLRDDGLLYLQLLMPIITTRKPSSGRRKISQRTTLDLRQYLATITSNSTKATQSFGQ